MSDQTRILIVEDDQDLADLLVDELSDEGFQVHHCLSTEAAVPTLHELKPHLVISDLRLPGRSGMDMLKQCRTGDTQPSFLMITAYGTINQAVEALKAGANEFLTKPFAMDHLILTVRKLLQLQQMKTEVEQYRRLLASDQFQGLIGRSRAMQSLYHQIQQIGPADGPVLVLGESGTGKELVAKAIHAESQRAEGPFIAVNCAGIPSELIESEFFGHAAGAFTGARGSRPGLFIQAEGGTLLLDEIAEMPFGLQAKLLRVLQEGTVRRVGEDTETPVNVRIIAATHQDLEHCIQDGRFREDLYYRLETFALAIPPLRERRGDTLLLARHFLKAAIQTKEPAITGFTREAEQALEHYPYPGNVRELQNAVERAIAFCDQPQIDRHHLPARIADYEAGKQESPSQLQAQQVAPGLTDTGALPSLETVQRDYIHRVLSVTGGNKRQAAAILGVTRRTLYRWLAKDDDPADAL
ncbi:MAG: sigma-54 dependent transcriptional regulator [Saccharospirillum sp.]|uniref:sigma-54-dependent transcriptional regulator n=1 Tax=Saccharospirillum sp. TaxID=2033801 RepID=UPI003297DD1A